MDTVLNPIQIGIDIGKITDYTAISIAEVVRVGTGRYRPCKRILPHVDREKGLWQPPQDVEPVYVTRFIIRQIGRVELGMSYPKQAEKIVDLFCSNRFERRKIRVLIDTTGVGQAVFDIVKVELTQRIHEKSGELQERLKQVSLQPTSFVHGQRYDRKHGTLGKDFLVSKMQALLQNGRIDIPDTAEAKATCEELKVYETRINEHGNAQHGAFQTGKHDDLVTALGLSCLEDPYAYAVKQSERVY